MALWDLFIGLGFLLSRPALEEMEILYKKSFNLFVWTIFALAFYFFSFFFQFTAFLALKNSSSFKKIRYILDLTQVGIVIWGLSLWDLIKDIPMDQKDKLNNDMQK